MRRLLQVLQTLCRDDQLLERHQPSGVNSRFESKAKNIDEYVAESVRRISAGRVDITDANRDFIVNGNSAFVLRPQVEGKTRRGIILLHGLFDSPFILREVADYFKQRGFLALALQHPGHGTRPGDLLHIQWHDWLHSLQRAIELMAAETEEIYLLGFSAGAALSLYQALQDKRIRGLFLFAPALRVRPLAKLAGPIDMASRFWKRLAWFDVQADDDYFKYGSMSNRSISEVYKLTQALERVQLLTNLDIPVFVAASEDDASVISHATLQWFEQLQVSRRMIYYSRKNTMVGKHVKLVSSYLPEQGIHSFSHTSLLCSPDNRHYGKQGEYRSCTHFHRFNPEKYRRCKAGDQDCLGEMFTDLPGCHVVRRLTYNPLFSELLAELDIFLEQFPG